MFLSYVMTLPLLAAALLLQSSTGFRGTGAIEGTIMFGGGAPAKRIVVNVVTSPAPQSPAGLAGVALTDDSGHYRIENLQPGSYLLLVGPLELPTAPVVPPPPVESSDPLSFLVGATLPCDPGSVNFHGYLEGTFTFIERKLIAVKAGEVVQSIVEVPRIPPERIVVKSRVLVDGKKPRPEFQIMFANRSGFAEPGFQELVSDDEMFETRLPEGLFGVVVTDLPDGYEVKSIRTGTLDLLRHPLLVSSASEPPTLTITLGVSSRSSNVKVSGRVAGPLADAGYVPALFDSESGGLYNSSCIETRSRRTPRIDLELDGFSFEERESEFSAVIRKDGSFEFPSVPPGTYSARTVTSAGIPPGTAIAPVYVVVPNRDMKDLELSAPPLRILHGRVEVENGKPLPRFVTLMFDPMRAAAPISATSSTLTRALVAPDVPYAFSVVVVLESDGSFTVGLREDRYEVTASAPASYRVQSLTYGSANLLAEPLVVTHGGAAQLRLTLTPPSSGVSVSGRIKGLDLAGPEHLSATVSMSADDLLAVLEAPLRTDGTFEFPEVIPGRYFVEVHMSDAKIDRSFKNIEVPQTGVQGLEMTVAYRKETTGRMVVQGRGPLLLLEIPLSTPLTERARIDISPAPDGTFTATLPIGEWRVADTLRLPPGYTLQSLTYGAIDLLRDPFKVTRSDTAQLRVTLSAAAIPVRVRGRVVGLTRASGPFCVRLLSNEYVVALNAVVDRNGSFEFTQVYSGSYSAEIGHVDDPIATADVSVTNADVRNLEIHMNSRTDGGILTSPCVQ